MVWAQKEENMKYMNNHYGQSMLFAPDTGGGNGGGTDNADDNGGDAGADNGNGADDGAGENDGKQTFDDLLKDTDYQKEFDRRVQKALNTAKEKWDAAFDDKLSEAEKLSKMTKEQKAQYEQTKKLKELEDREAAVTRKELMAEAKNTLSEKNIPVALAELLNYSDAKECSKSIEMLTDAFQKAVEAAVQDKIKGGSPLKKAGDNNMTLEQQIMNAMKA